MPLIIITLSFACSVALVSMYLVLKSEEKLRSAEATIGILRKDIEVADARNEDHYFISHETITRATQEVQFALNRVQDVIDTAEESKKNLCERFDALRRIQGEIFGEKGPDTYLPAYSNDPYYDNEEDIGWYDDRDGGDFTLLN